MSYIFLFTKPFNDIHTMYASKFRKKFQSTSCGGNFISIRTSLKLSGNCLVFGWIAVSWLVWLVVEQSLLGPFKNAGCSRIYRFCYELIFEIGMRWNREIIPCLCVRSTHIHSVLHEKYIKKCSRKSIEVSQ